MCKALLFLCPAVAVLSLGLTSPAARAESNWQKSYPLNGRPSLQLGSSDSSLDIHSCGSCAQVGIRIEWNDGKSSDYIVTESQTGNHVSFALKEKPSLHLIHFNTGSHRAPHVVVDTPQASDIDAQSSDGSIHLAGIQGNLTLHSSDGSLNASDVSGALRLNSSDGSIHIHNASGTLEAQTSDGSAKIDGSFSSMQIQSSDGSIELALNPGSKLAAASRIKSTDGSVKILVPADFAADLDLSVSDGHLDCQLPLAMDHYDSKKRIHGRLNGGSTPLEIHTSDGSVTLGKL